MPSYEFDHVGLVVHDIARAWAALRALGYDELSVPCLDERQGVEIAFAHRRSGPAAPCIELVQPSRPDSVVSSLLARGGAMPYHLCFRAQPLEPALDALDADGFRPIAEPAPAPAFGGARFCFLYHRELGLIELVELPPCA